MLGTGTQLDPYQITTVSQFRSMNDSTAYFKLINDLDVNDTQWVSGWTGVTLAFKEFDGDGHEIRNINDTSANNTFTFASSGVFKNVKILNIIKDRGTIFHLDGLMYLDFTDTTISANFVESVSSYMFFCASRGQGDLYVKNSAITVSGKLSSLSTGGSGFTTILNCMINFDKAIIEGNLIYTGDRGGGVDKISLTGKASITTSGRYLLGRAPKGCYCAVDFTDSTYKPKFSNTDPATACFYDKDLMGETLTAQTNVHALTTAQCKDKDYLNSIGFVVV